MRRGPDMTGITGSRLHHPAFATPPKLARPLAVTDPGALTCSTTGYVNNAAARLDDRLNAC